MKLLAVDSNSILNRAYYGVKPLTTGDGRYTHAIFGFLNILFKLQEEVRPDAIAFAFDLKSPTFRHLQFAGYKAQRKGMPEELAQQLEPMKAILHAMGYPILALEGYEADDILGTLAVMCKETQNQCVIATGDRDSFQLVGDGVCVRLASTKAGQSVAELMDQAAIVERYGVQPRQLIEVKALMGDSSDNIPGVAGIGEKTALGLIAQFGSLDGVYQNLEDPSMKAGVRNKLEQGREMAYQSRQLAEIFCQVPLDKTLAQLNPMPQDKEALYHLLSGLELRSLIQRLKLPAPASKAPQSEQVHMDLDAPIASNTGEGSMATRPLLKEQDWVAFSQQFEAEVVYCQVDYQAGQPEKIWAYSCCPCSLSRESTAFEHAVALTRKNTGKLVLPNSKEWYRAGFFAGEDLPLVAFDPILAQYVLYPLQSGYEAAFEELPQLHITLQKELVQKEQMTLLCEIEQPLSRVLASMEALGFTLDVQGLATYGQALETDLAELTQRIYYLGGGAFNINSPKQLGEVLFDRLGLPTKKKNKTGYSTDADVLASLKSAHPIVEDILAYRTLAKLKSTYVDGLIPKVEADGRVRSYFRQTETRTGRISSTEPNLQNIPVRTKRGSLLRQFFTAQEGWVLVDADYSQIELRVLAHIAQDTAMQQAFLNDDDIHTQTAAQVFDMPEAFVTPQMRSAAKAVNFGIVYGIGAFSLSQDIGVSISEADRYIKNYLATYSGVRQYMEDSIAFAKEHGYVKTMFGRRRPIPELSAQNKVTRSFGERVAMNTPIQGTAADIIKLAMIRVYNRLQAEGLQARLILQVHDELLVEAPQQEAQRVALLLTEEMQAAAQLTVALKADYGMGSNWLEAK